MQSVAKFWRQYDLEEKRKGYDETFNQLTKAREESIVRKKALIEATKAFKRDAKPEVLEAAESLLRQYQREIDNISKRALLGEKSFSDAYQALYEAPDPAPMLEKAVGMETRVGELETKVKKQAEELAEYLVESEVLKNQDATIKRLEEKIRGLESEIQSNQASRERLRQEMEEELRLEMAEEKGLMKKQLEEANDRVEEIRKLHQSSQNQLLEMQSRIDEMKVRHTNELDFSVSELEKANQRVKELEAINAKSSGLVSPYSASEAAPDPPNDESRKAEELEVALEAEREKVKKLNEQTSNLEKEHVDYKQESSKNAQRLQSEIESLQNRISELRSELDSRPTVKEMEDVKSQLEILLAVEYNRGSTGTESKEDLLIKKNKHLEHQLTAERLNLTEAQEELANKNNILAMTKQQLEQQRQLVARLEEDLLAAQTSSENKAESGPSDLDSLDNTSTSMASVLRNQRDRLREKCQQLESKLAFSEKEKAGLKSSSEVLMADNVALVERLRYLQGYRRERANALDIESGLAAEKKYSTHYEEKINPFKEFQGQQRERRRKELGILDRTVFAVGDLVFGNKYARLFVCLYIIVLHLLVMATLATRHNSINWAKEGIEKFCESHGFSARE